MIKVNPPLALRMPQKLLQDPELRTYFQDIQTILFQLATKFEQMNKHGSFFDTTTQTAAAINTAYAVTFNNTDVSTGVSIGTPTSRIQVEVDGVYNFQFSMQLINTSGGAHSVFIWYRINGVDIPNSATELRLQGNNAEQVAAWNFMATMDAGDYWELMWSVNDTAVQITQFAASSPVPAVPSVILTVDYVGYEV
jgi:hypothetical protein